MSGPRIVLVTGAFRSGTSLVASIVHRLGWPVAAMIPAPAPPTWRSDWEDADLTVPLLQGYRPGAGELANYLERRAGLSRGLGFGGRVAVKSPYLALIFPALLAACESIGEVPLVVRTYRIHGRERRLARTQLSREDDAAIVEALRGFSGDVFVEYGEAAANPHLVVRLLASRLGQPDDAAIAAAAASVGAPTRYDDAVPAGKHQ